MEAASTASIRPFPPLSVGRRAKILFPDLVEEGQMVDVLHGGLRFMPFSVEDLSLWGIPSRSPVSIEAAGLRIDAIVEWATPNCSAVGCRFLSPLSDGELEALVSLPLCVPPRKAASGDVRLS